MSMSSKLASYVALLALFAYAAPLEPSASEPTCSAGQAACGTQRPRGPDADHVLLQVEHRGGVRKSVTKHRSPGNACPGEGCPRVAVSGRQITVDGQPLHIKGICWSPTHRGDLNHPDYHYYLEQDKDLMVKAGINAVRTYDIDIAKDEHVLDVMQAAGIWVVPTVYSYGGNDPISVIAKINGAKHHPAILMWAIGNEWNYNGLYVDKPHEESLAIVKEVAKLVRQTDASRPIATVYGGLPSQETIDAIPDVDVWGVNWYSGITFGNLMTAWPTRSSKPLYIGEFGADAYNAKRHREDERSQAKATRILAREVLANSALFGGVCSGGFLFELSDEWWKDGKGSTWEHDVGGIAPGGGPYPDLTFNEEWWGIVDVERKPRLAYYAYAEVENPSKAKTL